MICLPIINLKLVAGKVAGQKPELVVVWVRNRELAAIYVSGQKSREGCPELVVVCVSGQKSGVGCSIRFMSKIRRSLKYSF